MHVIFEYPIVDCRPLLPKYNDKLIYPEWSNPSLNSKQFIRYFGALKERNAGGSADWTGEAFYCNTHLSMRYTDLHKQGYPLTPEGKPAIFNSYRRYFSDGYFVGKVEAGFVDNIEKKITGLTNSTVPISEILKHYANLPVTIDGKEYKTYKAGPQLAERYYKGSTQEKKLNAEQGKYVVAGEIAVLLIFNSSAALQLPERAFLLQELPLPDNYGSLKLYGYKLKHEGYALKAWLIEIPEGFEGFPKNVREILRNLRINLLRIHLEKETLRVLLNGIKNKKVQLEANSEEAQLADAYFKKTAEKLFKKERYSLEQKNLLQFALNSEETIAPGSFSSLQESVYYFQDKFTRDNIEKLLTGMAKKTILFICASPKGINPWDFGDEFSKIKESLRSGTDRNNYTVEIETAVRKDNFLNVLNQYKPDYLHISMHGSLTQGLYFEDSDKEKFPMPVEEFAAILELYSRDREQPAVIVLSACNSEAHAKAVKNYCKYAVGSQTAFPADAGVLYATKFYATLFEDNSMFIPKCHDAGKQAIQFAKKQFTPVNGIPVYDILVLI